MRIVKGFYYCALCGAPLNVVEGSLPKAVIVSTSGQPTERLVTVYRGVERESYSCAPICQRRITLGDGENYFKTAIDQAGSLSSQASGAAAAGAKSGN